MNQTMRTVQFSLTALGAAVVCFSPLALSAQGTVNSTTTTVAAPAPSAPALSPGLDEVVKLHDAGVDDSVIRSYVQNSNHAYSLSADDIIHLRQLGISAGVVTDMMQRGSELRQTRDAASAQQQAHDSAQLAAA